MSAGDGRRQTWVEWISVKDGLPPCAETVLAHVRVGEKGMRLRAFYVPRGCIYADAYDTGDWYEDTLYGKYQPRIVHRVTHWMPLPAGPETQA